MAVPTGTVTFLFIDIEDSARWLEKYPELMSEALRRCDAIVRQAIEQNEGYVFKTTEEGFCAAFHTAPDALRAALAAQFESASEPWSTPLSIKARIALHTGAAELRDQGYFGQPLNRVARLLRSGHGGQILISKVTRELIRDALPEGCSLKDLGEHLLRDLGRPERVFLLQHLDLPKDFPALKTLSSPELHNNLPVQSTSFIGREKEIAEVKGLLRDCGLLTLTGAGGSGKTRLSLQVAAEILDEYSDGVWLVELAALADPSLLAATVAHVLGISEQAGQPLDLGLIQGIESKRLLLVLDNCDHMAAECAQMASSILRSCPNARMLVTSRQALEISGEQTYRVPSLGLPDVSKPATPQSVSQFEAVRLFIDRASLAVPGFAVTPQNAPALAQICARLDGIPLAIELASARVRSLTVEEIEARLDQRFILLIGRNLPTLPRHQTLRALIDWSYGLLAKSEKSLLMRLSVFAGSWTLDSAQRVCDWENVEVPEVAVRLSDLVDQSLVLVDDHSGTTRYRLHETVRHYAAERLQESGEIELVKTRHRDCFLALAEEAEPHVKSTNRRQWLDMLESEHDNLRAALAWRGGESTGAVPGLRLVSALERFWYFRGFWSEGREHLRKVLDRADAPSGTVELARALLGAGRLAYVQGEYPAARVAFGHSLAVNRELDEKRGLAATLQMLGLVEMRQGDYAAARTLLEECLELLTELGDKPGAASQLLNLGIVTISLGDLATARTKCEAALSLG